MPDLSPLAQSLAPIVRDIVGPTIRVLLRTLAGTVLLAALVSAASFAVASAGNGWRGLAGLLIGLVTCGACGVVLAVKRTVLTAVKTVVERAHLGRTTSRLIFERMLGVDGEEAFMQRGGAAAKTVERLPLAQAEARLKSAATALFGEPDTGGWLRRKTRETLVRRVEAVTLAELRSQQATEGGIDLHVAGQRLAESIDEHIVLAVDGAMVRLTAALVGVAITVSLLAALLLRFS